jgi:hypothetical protein
VPKRILDGDALYRSQKLLNVEPEKYRAEYANLLPLALANGVCECNPRLVWSNVYSFNRPSITIQEAEKILDAIERADLIRRWKHTDGKIYAYFPGIEKGGRLPPPSRINRKEYTCGPEPPDVIRTHCVPLCSGSGSGSGKDICEDPNRLHESASSQTTPKPMDETFPAVKGVWDCYINTIGRNPKLYTFTPKRIAMGLKRWHECFSRAAEPKAENATAMMKLCIDRLHKSSFHNGVNDRGQKYIDWEILFRSQEQMEKWLNDDSYPVAE